MLRIVWFSIFFNYIEEQHGQKKEEQSEQDDQGKLLMLRIVWFSIFFNYIEEQKKEEQSEQDDQGKLLMLRIVWFSIFMFTQTVRIDIIMSSFFVTEKPSTPWSKKLRKSMLMCLRQLLLSMYV